MLNCNYCYNTIRISFIFLNVMNVLGWRRNSTAFVLFFHKAPVWNKTSITIGQNGLKMSYFGDALLYEQFITKYNLFLCLA